MNTSQGQNNFIGKSGVKHVDFSLETVLTTTLSTRKN